MSANTRLDSLSDLIKNRANVLVSCQCGRTHVLDAQRLARYAQLRVWNTQLEALRFNLKCGTCGRKNPRLKATPEAPTPADFLPKTEREWKLLARRLRG